jgi:hypothetical protein
MWPRDHAYYSRNNWAGKLKVGDAKVNDSPFNNAVAHDLMMMLFLAGPEFRSAANIEKVEGKLYRANEIESTDTAFLKLQTSLGKELFFYCTHACLEQFGPEIVVKGSEGIMKMSHKSVQIIPDNGETLKIQADDMRQCMMDAIVDVLNGGDSFTVGLDIAKRQTQVVEEIFSKQKVVPLQGELKTSKVSSLSTYLPDIEKNMRIAFEEENSLSLEL